MEPGNEEKVLQIMGWKYTQSGLIDDDGYKVQHQLDKLLNIMDESYKKGHVDGAIEVINNTCDICGAYPMTTNCNNANCDD